MSIGPIPRPRQCRPQRGAPAARRAALVRALAVVAAWSTAACREAVEAWSPPPPESPSVRAAAPRAAATDVAASLQYRFESPERDARYEHARLRLARYALAPSVLYADSIWTGQRGSRRELLAAGRFDGERYRLRASGAVPPPTRVGDSRHEVTLRPLPDGDWRWTTRVDHALGAVSPAATARVFSAWLRSAERVEDAVRADYLTSTPRMTRALGRLATLDSVRTRRLADGSTRVTLGIRLHASRIAATFPDFTRYLERYVSPARYRLTLHDRAVPGVHANDPWFVAEADDDRLTFHFRTRDGALAPLEGPLRPRPDTLSLRMDASVKVGPFTVGVRDLRGEFAFVRTPTETGWAMRFAHPPAWDLPPIAGRLVRGPLDRPFADDGATLRLSVRAAPGGGAVLHRATDVTVHESTLLRWLGNLGFTAVDEFAGRVEAEEARFLAEALRALGEDLRALPSR